MARFLITIPTKAVLNVHACLNSPIHPPGLGSGSLGLRSQSMKAD